MLKGNTELSVCEFKWLSGYNAWLHSEGSCVRILVETLRNFGNSVYPTLPVSFGEDRALKAVGIFYLVSMPGQLKEPTQGVNG